MIGKLSKMADGRMQTHAAGSEVNMDLLADLAGVLAAPADVVDAIRAANTARHVLELCVARGLIGLPDLICSRVAQNTRAHAGGNLGIEVFLVDFDGRLLGRHQPEGTAP